MIKNIWVIVSVINLNIEFVQLFVMIKEPVRVHVAWIFDNFFVNHRK